ncbi:hypothetical protein Tco_1425513 [Tanacetum coccineum]
MEVAPTTLEGVGQRVRQSLILLLDRGLRSFRDRPYHHRTAMALDREAVYARIAWTSSEERSAAIEAHILEARDPEPQDRPAEASSSC